MSFIHNCPKLETTQIPLGCSRDKLAHSREGKLIHGYADESSMRSATSGTGVHIF